MGPPPFGDGNDASPSRDTITKAILQWGHRLSAMETFPSRPKLTNRYMYLQWGHRLSAMETNMTGLIEHVRLMPSMGPPPFGDGNRLTADSAPVVRLFLQWGHRLSAMETRHAWLLDGRERQPSMGPPPFGDGNSTTLYVSAALQ